MTWSDLERMSATDVLDALDALEVRREANERAVEAARRDAGGAR